MACESVTLSTVLVVTSIVNIYHETVAVELLAKGLQIDHLRLHLPIELNISLATWV
jgi:hypothetical protein